MCKIQKQLHGKPAVVNLAVNGPDKTMAVVAAPWYFWSTKTHQNPQGHPQLEILETLLTRPSVDKSTFSHPSPTLSGTRSHCSTETILIEWKADFMLCALLSWVPSLMCHRCTSHPQQTRLISFIYARVCVWAWACACTHSYLCAFVCVCILRLQ